jgi:hypothetical protein
MKKLLRAAALAVALAAGACSLQACGTTDPNVIVGQTTMAGYDTIKGSADTADKLCTGTTPALSHDTCVTVRNDLRLAKDTLDKGGDIAAIVAKITAELK